MLLMHREAAVMVKDLLNPAEFFSGLLHLNPLFWICPLLILGISGCEFKVGQLTVHCI